jgi:hypothetical protein
VRVGICTRHAVAYRSCLRLCVSVPQFCEERLIDGFYSCPVCNFKAEKAMAFAQHCADKQESELLWFIPYVVHAIEKLWKCYCIVIVFALS